MRQVIDEMNAKYDDIEVLLGLEANVLDVDGHLDVDDSILELNDVLLAGYHFGVARFGLSEICCIMQAIT